MSFGDLTHRPFEQLIREVNKDKGLPLDAGITVKPDDIQVTQDHIDSVRRGQCGLANKHTPALEKIKRLIRELW